MVITRFITALTLSAVLASPAWTAYIYNKQTWDDLGLATQYGYAMGAYDEMITLFSDDNASSTTNKQRTEQCIYDAKLTSADLVDLINTAYSNDISIWKFSPNIVLRQALYKYCN